MAHPVYTFILCWSYFIFRSGKSEGDEDDIETEDAPSMDDVKNIKLPDVKEDDSKKSINYGYHPIIDFFGNFRFDTA